MNPIFVKGLRNILRNRYKYRNNDGTYNAYNESINIIPEEFADQDEYKAEKFAAKIYEDRYNRVKRMKEKLYNIPPQTANRKSSSSKQLKPEATAAKYSSLNDVATETDMPVKLEKDPYGDSLKKCIFCQYNLPVDYKNIQLLSQFVSPQTGLPYSQHVTGLCIHKHQEVERAIVKAKRLGMMPYFHKENTFVTDPKLFDTSGKNQLKLIPDKLTRIF